MFPRQQSREDSVKITSEDSPHNANPGASRTEGQGYCSHKHQKDNWFNYISTFVKIIKTGTCGWTRGTAHDPGQQPITNQSKMFSDLDFFVCFRSAVSLGTDPGLQLLCSVLQSLVTSLTYTNVFHLAPFWNSLNSQNSKMLLTYSEFILII